MSELQPYQTSESFKTSPDSNIAPTNKSDDQSNHSAPIIVSRSPKNLVSESQPSSSILKLNHSLMFRLLTRQQVLKWSIPIGLGLLGVTISKQFSGNKFQESSNLPPKTYENLENFLKAKQWKEADQESTRLMLKIANREKEGWFDTNSIETFPCDFLSTIDRLWVDNSNGKFGLSIQKKIYIEVCGGKTLYYDEKEWQCFGDTVGWRASKYWLRYNDVKFDNTAPKGSNCKFRF